MFLSQKAVLCHKEKTRVLGKFYLGRNYSAVAMSLLLMNQLYILKIRCL